MMYVGNQYGRNSGGLSMVFYDRLGIRKQYVWGLALIALLLLAMAIGLVYMALAYAPAAEALSYENRGDDATYKKTIALTFDDGPHPTYTREIIEVLKQEGVPATFFLIGEHVVSYPETTRYILEQGFEIGNHSFTHSPAVQSSETRLRNELISTDRVIRDATGKTPILFRPPMLENIDVGEYDGAKLDDERLRWAEKLGYIVVGANVDTQDWNVAPGQTEVILERIRARMPEEGPVVVLMHDEAGAGATAEALRTFIPEMKAAGYRFVPVSEYFGLTQEESMPLAASPSALDIVLVGAAKALVNGISAFNTLVLFVSVLGLVRLWGILAARRMYVPLFKRRHARSSSRPPVSVLIPAYNEEANIEATIRSVFASTNAYDEVIVIDDGSGDRTAEIVRKLIPELGPQLVLLQKENGGTKGGALQCALSYARHGVIVCIDADTVIDKDAIPRLARHFEDTSVAAVAGKVYPARVTSLLGAFQYLEYMQGQNLDKEVFAVGNAIHVVPGALGAWRTAAVREVGGYSLDTVVEDQDLTLALVAAGHRIIFDPAAAAYTETPATVKQFFRQRSRWVYGTIQCVWKYRSWFFSRTRPSLGFLILPNVVLFNLCIPLLVPILDIGVLLGLGGFVSLSSVLLPFLIYTLFDIWCAIEGLSYERVAPKRLIPLVIWQRFFYRYVLAAAIIQSVGVALAGTFVAWGLQKRRGECHPALQNMIDTGSALTPSPIQITRTPVASSS
jgi:cellulose synthase/poly-beta-1,6-N-acetylglucosamine synthase-like glycosyltransferase/peptidoglycan/xylan/chitin deacetylase (PgdA/CDA1 family)